MRAGYRDAALVAARNNAQHNAALNAGDALLNSRPTLGIRLLYRRRVNYQLGAIDVFSRVTHVNGNAVALHFVERFALVHVGARNLKALAHQYLGDGAHAAAADAYEMYSFDLVQKLVVIHKYAPLFSEW